MHILLSYCMQVCTIVQCMSSRYESNEILEKSLVDTNKVVIDIFDFKNQDVMPVNTLNTTKNNNTTLLGEKQQKRNDSNEISSISCQGHPIGNSKEDESSTTLVNYPFSVSVQRKGAHHASGALIGKKWILSTAGEFYYIRESIKLFRARLGSVDCKNGGTVVPIRTIEFHPSYIYGLPNFDLGLLRTAQLVEFTDYIKPIALSRIRSKVISATFMVTYWPRVIVKGQALPDTAKEREKQNSMRVSTQRLIPHNQCSVQMYNMLKNATLHESTLCLKPFVTHHSPCLPDAGAPVVAEDGLWGITSGWTSYDCLKNHSPTIFTRVSSLAVRLWLDATIDASSATLDWDSSQDTNYFKTRII